MHRIRNKHIIIEKHIFRNILVEKNDRNMEEVNELIERGNSMINILKERSSIIDELIHSIEIKIDLRQRAWNITLRNSDRFCKIFVLLNWLMENDQSSDKIDIIENNIETQNTDRYIKFLKHFIKTIRQEHTEDEMCIMVYDMQNNVEENLTSMNIFLKNYIDIMEKEKRNLEQNINSIERISKRLKKL